MTKIEIEIPAGKRAEWQEIDGKTTLVLVDEKNVMERVKSFEDACRELGIDADTWHRENETCKTDKDVLAYLKLKIVVAALNEGWKPSAGGFDPETIGRPETDGKYRYYPSFRYYSSKEIKKMDVEKKAQICMIGNDGFGFLDAYYTPSFTYNYYNNNLSLRSYELAKYCGKQFIDIWKDYLFK